VTDREAVVARITATHPDAVVHLAAVSSGAETARDPAHAIGVAVGGTLAIVAGLASLGRRTGERPILLVAGSSEIYGAPEASELPLVESSPVRPVTAYAMTKAAQEAVALRHGAAAGLRVIAVRAFNHIGPGQSPAFAVPAFASRIMEAKAAGRSSVAVGDIDIRRDLTDVRDVAEAYRRLIEFGAVGQVSSEGLVVNVASGRSVLLRDVVAELADLAGIAIEPVVDEALLRAREAREIRGDPARLTALTGWKPTVPLRRTLGDIIAELGTDT
jgi:GDP-4-dehydro-6-deoxy-D-mannose reductase